MSKKTILYIDTIRSDQTTIALIYENKRHEMTEKTDSLHRSQNVLSLIEKMLAVEKVPLTHITEIQVNDGPGSFTGVRVGVTVANTLGWVLDVPVNGKEIAVPHYVASKFD